MTRTEQELDEYLADCKSVACIPTEPAARLQHIEEVLVSCLEEQPKAVEYFTPADAAALLGISEERLAKIGKQGPRSFRLGKKTLYSRTALHAFINGNGSTARIPAEPLARLEFLEKLLDDIERELAQPVEYLSPPAAANFISFSEAQLAQWRSVGKGGPRFYRHGHKILYSRRDLRIWVESEGAEARQE